MSCLIDVLTVNKCDNVHQHATLFVPFSRSCPSSSSTTTTTSTSTTSSPVVVCAISLNVSSCGHPSACTFIIIIIIVIFLYRCLTFSYATSACSQYKTSSNIFTLCDKQKVIVCLSLFFYLRFLFYICSLFLFVCFVLFNLYLCTRRSYHHNNNNNTTSR